MEFEYHYRKPDKIVVKRGKKRNRDHSNVDPSLSNEIVWTQRSSDPQVDATDDAYVLGAFTGANFDAVNTLNREFDKQKVEIIRLKEELEQVKRQYEDRYDELQVRNVALHDELQIEKNTNATLVQKLVLLEKQYEDATASAASSSFSKFSQEEFNELALRTNGENSDLVT